MKNNRNIMIMIAISFLQGMIFYGAVSTLYRQAHGVNLFEMGILDSVLSILILLFEIPWGVICEHIGYKKTMLICNFLYLLSKIVFWKAEGFVGFLIERILLAIVVSGLSGCDTAFLYLNIEKDESTKIFGYYNASGTLGMMIAALLFSICLKQDIMSSACWTIPPYALAFVLTLLLEDVKEENSKKENKKTMKMNIQDYAGMIRKMIFFLIAAALLSETTHTLANFYSQLQYERVHIPIESYGLLYAFVSSCSLANGSIGRIVNVMKEEKLIFILYMVSFCTCLVLFSTTSAVYSVIAVALLQICEAMFLPAMNTLLNRNAYFSRATLLSIYSMVMNLIGIVTNLIFGWIGDLDFSYTFLVGSIFCMIGFILYLIWYRKSNKKN